MRWCRWLRGRSSASSSASIIMQPREQRGLLREKRRRFVDVRYHVVDRANRIAQSRKPQVGQSVTAVEDFAHDVVQRFGDADAVPRFGHLRAAAQGVDGAIHRLRQIVRRRLTGALAQIFANLGQMARGLLAVDLVQHGIHRRRLRRRRVLRRGGRCARGAARGGRVGSRAAILRRQCHRALIGLAAVGVGKRARHQRLDRHRVVPPGFQLLHQLRQGGDARCAAAPSFPACATASCR